MEIKFKILGKPKGKQRPRLYRINGRNIIYTPKQTSEYEKLIRASYMAVSKIFFKKDIPLEIDITAFFNGKYSDSGWATKKPDSDNIIKIVLDGLNKVAYYDDAQICKLSFEKRYSKIPRVEVKIKSLEEKTNMKTTKIYDDEKMVYSGNCYVNTVIFRGRIYDDIKEISQNGIKFSLRLSNGKNEESSEWNKPTFANCVAFGDLADKIKKSYSQNDEIFLIAKYTSRKQNDVYYKNFVIRELISNKETEESSQQKIKKLIETDDLPF